MSFKIQFKRSLFALLFLLAFQSLKAQDDHMDSCFDSATLHIAKDNINCLYGLKNIRNDWVLTPQYNYLVENYQDLRYFKIEHNGKLGMIRKDGKYLIQPIYDEIKTIQRTGPYVQQGVFAFNDYFVLRLNKQEGLFCAQTQKLSIPFSTHHYTLDKHYLIVKDSNGLCGLADSNQIVLNPQFNILFEFNSFCLERTFVYSMEKLEPYAYDLDTNVFGLLHANGEILTKPNYSKFIKSSFTEFESFWAIKRITANKNTQIDLIDSKGKVLLSRNDPNEQVFFNYYNQLESNAYLAILPCKDSEIVVNARGEILDVGKSNSFKLLKDLEQIATSGFIYKNNGLYGLKDGFGKVIIAAAYEQLLPFVGQKNKAEYQFFIAKKGNKFGVLNRKNKTIYDFKYQEIFADKYDLYLIENKHLKIVNLGSLNEVKNTLGFGNNLAIFCKDIFDEEGHCGLVDKDYEVVLMPEYFIKKLNASTWFFSNQNKRGKVHVDQSIHIDYSDTFKEIGDFKYGYTYAITNNDKAVLIDENFRIIGDTNYRALTDIDPLHEVFWVKSQLSLPPDSAEEEDYDDLSGEFESGNWGLKNLKGDLIFDTVIDHPSVFLNGRSIVASNGMYGVISHLGQTVIPLIYDSLFYADTGLFILYRDGKFGLADWNGRALGKMEYTDCSVFLGPYAVFKKDSNLVLVDRKGQVVLDFSKKETLNHVQLDSLIVFEDVFLSSPHGYGELSGYRFENIYEVFDSIYARDTLLNQTILRVLINHFAQIVLPNFLYCNSSFLPYNEWAEIQYASVYDRNNFFIDRGEESTVINQVINLFAINKGAVSYAIEESISTSSGFSEGYTSFNYRYLNFVMMDDSLVAVQLKDLFVSNYKSKLKSIFINALKSLDDVDIDCKNPEILNQNLEKAFSITPNGIIFYINPHGDSGEGSSESGQVVEILISYKELASIAAKNGILSEFY